MKKRLLSALLTFCMVLTLLPVSALAAPVDSEWSENSDSEYFDYDYRPERKKYDVRIELASGIYEDWDWTQVVEGDDRVTVTLSNGESEDPMVQREDGMFGSLYVYLNDAVREYDDDLTATVTTKDGYTATVDLEEPYSYYRDYYYGEVESRDWDRDHGGGDWGDGDRDHYGTVTFDVYYLIGDEYPNPLHASGAAEDYGPGRDDTPLCELTIDIDDLVQDLQVKYNSTDVVDDNYNGRGTWAITPETCRESDYDAWWDFVCDYVTGDGLEDLEATGLADYFVGYVLKNQDSGGDYHLDGKLSLTPPVYSVELYLNGGSPREVIARSNSSASYNEVREAYEECIAEDFSGEIVNINWTDLTFTVNGQSYEIIEGRHTPNDNSTIKNQGTVSYARQSKQYYLAQFYLSYEKIEPTTGTLTVSKTFTGLGADEIPSDFTITISGSNYNKTLGRSGAEVSVDGTTYTWVLSDLAPGEYTAEESGANVPGYTYEVNGNESANVTAGGSAKIELTNTYTADATINYVAVPEEGGSVSRSIETVPAGNSPQGSTATANEGWYFVGWYDNEVCDGDPVETDKTIQPTHTTITTYYAKFAEKTDVTITITGNSDTLEYNGQSQSVTGYDYEVNVENVIANVSYTSDGQPSATGTNASTYNMGLSADNFTYTFMNPADEGKYEVTVKVVDGKLEITPKDVTIIAASDSKTYDGTALTNGTYAVVDGTYTNAPEDATYSADGVEIIAGEPITATVTGSQTNAGTSANVPSNATVTVGDTNNYTFHYVNGTLTVNKASVTITVTGNTQTETYDGTEKTVEGFAVTGNPTDTTVELAVGETAKATGVNVNTYYMGLDENSFVLEGDTAENYAVTWKVTDGWLQIIDNATLTVSAPNVTTTYDGAAHPVTPTASVPGATITVTYTDADGNTITGEPIDAGTYTAAITATLPGYAAATSSATVTINPATLSVTTPNAIKVYDGTPLTATGNAAEDLEGLVNGETVTFAVTGSQTEIGSSKNTYSLVWDGTANQSNYTIVENLGTLTVTSATGVTVVKEAAEPPVGGYVAGDTITWTITVTNTGTEAVHGLSLTDSIDGVTLSNENGVNPTNFELAAGGAVTFTATLANAPAGTYTNSVTVSQNGTDLGNDPADPVIVTEQAPNLTVSKEADKDTAQVGDTVTYTITVTNTGNVPLTGVTVTDEFDGAGNLTFIGYDAVDNDNGTYTITIGNMAKGASVTITATYIVLEADASNNTITNTAAANADGLDDTPPATETVTVSGQFTLTYDANGGSFGNEEETFTVPNLSGGTYTLTDTQGYNEPTNGNYVFIGWSETQPETAIGAGEKIPDCITEVTLNADNPTRTVYAVWGEDKNDDGVADAQQVFIEPAPIVIYTGGAGYNGAVQGSSDSEVGTTSTGLPEPGFYITLPHAVDAELKTDAETGEIVNGALDLSNYLSFSYYDDAGNEIRHWNLERYDMGSGDSQAYNRFIYRMLPDTYTDTPIRLQFTDEDGNITITDTFPISMDELSQNYSMTIYDGGLNQKAVTANIVGITEDITVGVDSSTLTVRGVTAANGVPTTTEVLDSAPDSQLDNIQAHADGEVTYYINDSDLEVRDPSAVALLVDELVDEGVDTLLAEAEDRLGLAWYEDYEYQTQYLDLVDTSNGNAYVTLGAGDSVDIHWPMPNGTSRWNTEFYVVHFDGLDRNFDNLDAQLDSGNVDLQVYTLGNGLRIENGNLVFTTDTFSPFVLIWQDSDRDWPDDDDDDDNDRPSHDDDDDNDRPEQEDPAPELDKESHIAYVSGTPEGTIEPNAYITREEVATIFFRLLTDRSRANYITNYNPFPDVDSSRWSFYPIVTMNNAGIMHGYDDGNFAPSGYITRAEFAVVAAQFSDAEYTGADLFSDISGHWAREYINRAASEGWISGYPDGSFGPDDYITRAQVMALVNEVLDRAPDADYMLDDMITWPDNADESAWYYEDVQEATNSHSYVWRNSGRTSEEWEDLIDTRTLDELVRDAFNGVGISY